MSENPYDTNDTRHENLPIAGSAEHARQHPEEWVTEDGPMTEAQASLLSRLCRDAGEPFDPQLSKAHALQRIDELQKRARGTDDPPLLVEDQTDG